MNGDLHRNLGRERRTPAAEHDTYRLAAIVESSDDAIVSKDLNGVIKSWNQGAERLFGYSAEEAIGQSVTILIPDDRHDEEPGILARIRRGERIDHYETTRRRKDGCLVDISLTVSPIRDAGGAVIGASKIARDITERRRAQEQQQVLLREMHHRIKNLFAVSASVVALSVGTARTPQELADVVASRLGALARAHILTLPDTDGERAEGTTIHALVRAIVSPYDDPTGQRSTRIRVHGDDLPIAGDTVTSFALLLHEFTTNAVKYGALSNIAGRIAVECQMSGTDLTLTWTEHGGPRVRDPEGTSGFGTWLAEATVRGQFRGEIERDWRPEGLVVRLRIPRAYFE
jgi:PAS domain S-box-containing protein